VNSHNGKIDAERVRKEYEFARRHGKYGSPSPDPFPEDQRGDAWDRPFRPEEPAEPDANESLIQWANEVEPRAVRWLWPATVPLGKLTTFAGPAGLGKTFCLLDIASRVTRGADWPCGAASGEAGTVLYISGEDDPEDTLVPRLMALEALLDRVAFLTFAALNRFSLADLPLLEKTLGQMAEKHPDLRPRLAVIDPPTSYLLDVDDHKNSELRRLLTPLQQFASQHEISVIFNTHLNKAVGRVDAATRVMGSVAWVAAVRAAHLFVKDPDDHQRRLFLPIKSNLGPERKGLAYRLVPTGELARIEWLGEVDTEADAAVNHEPAKPRRVVAQEWLIDLFRQKREWPSDELFHAAKAEGISRIAIFQAKHKLELPKAKQVVDVTGDRTWVWWVPENWPPLRDEIEV